MDAYKKKSLNFTSGIDNKIRRAHQRDLERRNSRHLRLSAVRNIEPCLEESLLDSTFSTCEQPPVENAVPIKPIQKQQPSRFDMLMKWKKEKELKKVLDSKKNQPFLTSRVINKPLPAFPLKPSVAKDKGNSTINISNRSLRPPQAAQKQNIAAANVIKKPQMLPPKSIPKQASQIKSGLPARSVLAKPLPVSTNARIASSTSRMQIPTGQVSISSSQSAKNQNSRPITLPTSQSNASKGTRFGMLPKHAGIKSQFGTRALLKNLSNKNGASKAIEPPRPLFAKPVVGTRQKMSVTANTKVSSNANPPSAEKFENRPSFAPSDFNFTAPLNLTSIIFSKIGRAEKKSIAFTPKNFTFFCSDTPGTSSVQKKKSSSKKAKVDSPSAMQTPSILRKAKKIESFDQEKDKADQELTNVADESVSLAIPNDLQIVSPKQSAPETVIKNEAEVITTSTEDDDEIFNERPPEEIYMDVLDVSLSASPMLNSTEAVNEDDEDPALHLKSILSMCPPKRVSERLSRRLSLFHAGDKPKLNSITEITEAIAESPHVQMLKSLDSPTNNLTPRRSRRLAIKHTIGESPIEATCSPGLVIVTPKSEMVTQFSALNVTTPEPVKQLSQRTPSSKNKKACTALNEENLMAFSPDSRRRSSRLSQKFTPLQAIDNRLVQIEQERATPARSPVKLVRQQRKISLLGSPQQYKTRLSSIKDLMAFSPDA